MKLYTYFRSSSAWRVRLALAIKGVAHEAIFVNLVHNGGEQHLPEFARFNPLSQVPVLVDADLVLFESVAICEYLEERYPEPPLLPRDPAERARCRQAVEIVNTGMQPFQNLAVRSALEAEGLLPTLLATKFITRGLLALEALAQPGPYFLGETPQLADLYLIPQLYASRRVGVSLDPFPKLLAVEKACAELSAFVASHPDNQPDAQS